MRAFLGRFFRRQQEDGDSSDDQQQHSDNDFGDLPLPPSVASGDNQEAAEAGGRQPSNEESAAVAAVPLTTPQRPFDEWYFLFIEALGYSTYAELCNAEQTCKAVKKLIAVHNLWKPIVDYQFLSCSDLEIATLRNGGGQSPQQPHSNRTAQGFQVPALPKEEFKHVYRRYFSQYLNVRNGWLLRKTCPHAGVAQTKSNICIEATSGSAVQDAKTWLSEDKLLRNGRFITRFTRDNDDDFLRSRAFGEDGAPHIWIAIEGAKERTKKELGLKKEDKKNGSEASSSSEGEDSDNNDEDTQSDGSLSMFAVLNFDNFGGPEAYRENAEKEGWHHQLSVTATFLHPVQCLLSDEPCQAPYIPVTKNSISTTTTDDGVKTKLIHRRQTVASNSIALSRQTHVGWSLREKEALPLDGAGQDIVVSLEVSYLPTKWAKPDFHPDVIAQLVDVLQCNGQEVEGEFFSINHKSENPSAALSMNKGVVKRISHTSFFKAELLRKFADGILANADTKQREAAQRELFPFIIEQLRRPFLTRRLTEDGVTMMDSNDNDNENVDAANGATPTFNLEYEAMDIQGACLLALWNISDTNTLNPLAEAQLQDLAGAMNAMMDTPLKRHVAFVEVRAVAYNLIGAFWNLLDTAAHRRLFAKHCCPIFKQICCAIRDENPDEAGDNINSVYLFAGHVITQFAAYGWDRTMVTPEDNIDVEAVMEKIMRWLAGVRNGEVKAVQEFGVSVSPRDIAVFYLPLLGSKASLSSVKFAAMIIHLEYFACLPEFMKEYRPAETEDGASTAAPAATAAAAAVTEVEAEEQTGPASSNDDSTSTANSDTSPSLTEP